MKKCPKCGRELLDKAVMCAYCGAALPAPEEKAESVPEVFPDPIVPAPETIPEQPAAPKLSRKKKIALICAAAVLLVGIGLLVFFLTRGGNAVPVIKSRTIAEWMEIDGQETNRRETRIAYDERGLPVKMETSNGAGNVFTGTFTYEFDDHRNPKTLTVEAISPGEESETLHVDFANQYDGAELVRVDITSEDAGGIDYLLSNFFSGYTGYRNALVKGENSEIQFENGRTVHLKQAMGDSFVNEYTYEYKNEKLAWSIRKITEQGTESYYAVTQYDELGRIVSLTEREDGVTRTYAIVYTEGKGADGKPCVNAELDMERCENLTEEDIANFSPIRYYLNSDGKVEEMVTGGPQSNYSTTRYDNQGRMVSSYSENKYDEHYVSCSETTYEYR